MKNLFISLLLPVLFLQACVLNQPVVENGGEDKVTVEEDKNVAVKKVQAPDNAVDCEKVGGMWGPIGLFPEPLCNMKTADGGKKCNDADECEGACLASLNPAEEDSVTAGKPVKKEGKCSEWSAIVGCLAFVEDGFVNSIMCLD